MSIIRELETAEKMANLYSIMAVEERNNRAALIEFRRLERRWRSRLAILKRFYVRERRRRLRKERGRRFIAGRVA